MAPKHQRMLFIGFSVVFLCAATLMTLNAFRDNIVFFYSPSDLQNVMPTQPQTIRLGGLVKTGSVSHQSPASISVHEKDVYSTFIITDGVNEVQVEYNGVLPNLFREGQGVVVEGMLEGSRRFRAMRVLAKHDETYMPPEVADAIKKSGHWQGKP